MVSFLTEHGPATMTQIAEGIGLSPTGVGHWVRQLVRDVEVVREDPQPPERSYRYAAARGGCVKTGEPSGPGGSLTA